MYTKIIRITITALVFFLPINIEAQAASHSAVLTWTLSSDDTAANCPVGAACSQNVYRASGNCSVSSNFQILTNSLSGTYSATTPPVAPPSTYTDATLTPGVWCYAVSFVLNGSESPKVSAQALVTPTSPSSLVIVAK